MSDIIKVGDCVKLISLPQWLIADLPENEQRELCGFIGLSTQIIDIDSHGYYWLGFGNTDDKNSTTYYSGHSFVCVEIILY